MRPEGPSYNRPGRKAGICNDRIRAPKERHIQSAAPSELNDAISITPALRPGLFTAGPLGLNYNAHLFMTLCIIHLEMGFTSSETPGNGAFMDYPLC